MVTEVVTQSDPTWMIVAIVATVAAAAILFYHLRHAEPTGPFRPYFAAEHAAGEGKLNKVVLILLNVQSHTLELELAQRLGMVIMRKNRTEIFLTGRDCIWHLCGVPMLFVYGDRVETIDAEAIEALVKFGEANNIAGYEELAAELENLPEEKRELYEISPNMIVPFSQYYNYAKEISPAKFYEIATELANANRKRSLFDLLENPMVLAVIVIIIIAIVGLLLLMGGGA